MNSPSVQRVAVVRLDALGDTLLSTPAIDVLCRHYGEKNVLVVSSPGLGCIFGEAPAHFEAAKDASPETIANAIDEFGADIVYVFSEKKRALKSAFLSKAKQRIGFDPGWTQPLRSLEVKRYLTLRFPIVNSLESDSRYHEVERYCRLVAKGLSKKSINGGSLRFFSVDSPSKEFPLDAPVGFQWAAKWLQEGWPADTLLSLLEELPPEALIFVAPNEKADAEAQLPEHRRAQLVCVSSLRDYALELSKCRYLVSIDTGAVHVAAAMGVPVVDVFPKDGAHHTVPRWRPWMTPHQVVLKESYEGTASLGRLKRDLRSARESLEKVLAEFKLRAK